LLLKHIQENQETGCKLEELCQVLPALSTTHVRSLLRTLERRAEAHPEGMTNQAKWFAGPRPAKTAAPDDLIRPNTT
jgi:hypothetical protein